MSEYQYYEFQAIDRPLNEEERSVIGQISSRADLTPTRAAFTYNYSDFPRSVKEILTKYFDAMIYLTNWGSKQLMFRFPKSLIETEQIQPYCFNDFITLSSTDNYTILNIEFHEEEGGEWVEGEEWLPSLVMLRNDILQQDYRVRYLAWLKATEMEDTDDASYEPPVPPGLGKLSGSLSDFAELFEIDRHLIKSAAKKSPDQSPSSDGKLIQAITKLPRKECDEFLLKLAHGEPHLSVKLNKRLRELSGTPQPEPQQQRTVKQLFEVSKQERMQELKKKARQAEAERIQRLEELSQRETQVWEEVHSLIQKSQPAPYGKAVQYLSKLEELAIYKDQKNVFQERISQICDQYRRRSSFIKRLRKMGWCQ